MIHIVMMIASTRTTRFADHVGPWVRAQLDAVERISLDVVDIRDLALPYFDRPAPPAAARRGYASVEEEALGERLDAADGYVVITNEYNHGYSAALKNVLDHYFAEFEHKPVAFVGYGGLGASRAIEQLRQVVAQLNMVSVRESVHIVGTQFSAIRTGGSDAGTTFLQLEPRMQALIENLTWWSDALAVARANDPAIKGE